MNVPSLRSLLNSFSPIQSHWFHFPRAMWTSSRAGFSCLSRIWALWLYRWGLVQVGLEYFVSCAGVRKSNFYLMQCGLKTTIYTQLGSRYQNPSVSGELVRPYPKAPRSFTRVAQQFVLPSSPPPGGQSYHGPTPCIWRTVYPRFQQMWNPVGNVSTRVSTTFYSQSKCSCSSHWRDKIINFHTQI